ncbi:uncharacterized protein PHACADRAFT_212306 [Phanerochaete carnosa HHB-10118-sp]|uniref:Uncharacterized protein n=1 Tax=Phanerochaete carnosa (strain HHB-10118-sp) TaxID=650164 RepID=K5VYI8_PHACS|nr:uncharacterized protein PHACADRAFT_212306 [Phanerochaete carnosa HHB-10118-sp]EKM51674.1 hypothetical protein PHACADRAFT_212306 [Phanerochaete carnosa HHB-10118-sp]
MQLTLTFSTLLALVYTATATPAHPGFTLSAREADGAYVFDRVGGLAFTPAHILRRTESDVEVPREAQPEPLEKRDSYNCFAATFSGGDKLSAVNALYNLLDDYPIVNSNGAIATQYADNAIVYVCNFSGADISANAQDVKNYDNSINNACGSSTAGRVLLSSGLEYGRTAAGKPFCDGS